MRLRQSAIFYIIALLFPSAFGYRLYIGPKEYSNFLFSVTVIMPVVFGSMVVSVIFTMMFFMRTEIGRPYLLRQLYFLAIIIATIILFYATVYQQYGLIDGNTPTTNVRDCIYFSIITWTTTGYGDIRPSPDSRLFAASEALVGYITMGLYLAVLFHAMSTVAHSTDRTSVKKLSDSP